MSVESRLLRLWYGPAWRTVALWPLEGVYRLVTALRRAAYRVGLLPRHSVGSPVVVVGNLTVGGTGKTPVAAWLAAQLRARGLRTAVILRGYGGRHDGAPLRVTHDSDPAIVGDEAVLHARRGADLVFVGRDRVAAARAAAAAGAQVVVCDDGLQHLRLVRQFEIAVVDAARGLGNGHLLPAGPLREPRSRLATVDAVVLADRGANAAATMTCSMPRAVHARLRLGAAVNLQSGARRALDSFRGETLKAVAGIGHPDAFFSALRSAGLTIEARAFPDHAPLDGAAMSWTGVATVLMTEKDAVKCRSFARPAWWYVDLELGIEPASAARELLVRVLDAAGLAHVSGERLG
jgi:tetraacyldisaccharide 4'-kinase